MNPPHGFEAINDPDKQVSRDEPTDPHARIAVATYPLRSILMSPTNGDRDTSKPGMDLPTFARFVRSEFHVRGIEPLSLHFPSTEPGEILKLAAAFDAAGVHTVNIPVDDSVELCSTNAATRNAGNARYRTCRYETPD